MTKKFYEQAVTPSGVLVNHRVTPVTSNFPLEGLEIAADRIRPLDEQAVANMACSLEREGQLKPILIRVWLKAPNKHARPPVLISGAHRVEAARRLEWTHLSAWLFECDDGEARQAEIDENLVRKELSEVERGRLYKAWLELRAASATEATEESGAAEAEAEPEAEVEPTTSEKVTPAHHPSETAITETSTPSDQAATPTTAASEPRSRKKPGQGPGARGGISELASQTGETREAIKDAIVAADAADKGEPAPQRRRRRRPEPKPDTKVNQAEQPTAAPPAVSVSEHNQGDGVSDHASRPHRYGH